MSDYDWKNRSVSGMGEIALLLGWQLPQSGKSSWFHNRYGLVHDVDLGQILKQQLVEIFAKAINAPNKEGDA